MRRYARWVALAVLTLLSTFAHNVEAQDVRKLVTISTTGKIRAVSVCGTGGLAAGLVHDDSIAVWRLPSGEAASSWKTGAKVTSLACSSDGKWVALGKGDGSVEIEDMAGKPARTLQVAHGSVDDLAYAPDGSLLAVSVHEKPVQLWNALNGSRVAELETDFSGSTGMAFSPDSATIATSDADTVVRIYDRSGKLKAKYTGLLLEPFAISFAPNGKEIVVGGADCTLTILEASNAQLIRQLPKRPDPIFQAAALPDGHSLLSLEIDAATLGKYAVVVWNLGTGAQRELTIDGSKLVGYGAISNHQPVLFTADSDSSLSVWAVPE
ncbi:MAG: WD40 repeat domain-containing protein [Candidatus Acidiferrales bacterium]